MVLCKGACVSIWKPLTISGGSPKGDSLSGKLGVVRRPDGSKQVTYNGKLLYTFYVDKPGEVRGDGAHDAFGGQKFSWHVVRASGAATSPNTGQGTNQSGGGGYFSY
jgi:predicted lipoprotein with Yx(FWY)xxD motif